MEKLTTGFKTDLRSRQSPSHCAGICPEQEKMTNELYIGTTEKNESNETYVVVVCM